MHRATTEIQCNGAGVVRASEILLLSGGQNVTEL